MLRSFITKISETSTLKSLSEASAEDTSGNSLSSDSTRTTQALQCIPLHEMCIF